MFKQKNKQLLQDTMHAKSIFQNLMKVVDVHASILRIAIRHNLFQLPVTTARRLLKISVLQVQEVSLFYETKRGERLLYL